MTKEETKKALEAYEEWTVEKGVTLNGVKEILASRDAWLACWEYLTSKDCLGGGRDNSELARKH